MKKWEYASANNSLTGEMLCCSCGKKITDGYYRYYLDYKKDAFINQHRACGDDNGWSKFDDQQEATRKNAAAYEDACKTFSEQWGINLESLLAL